MRRFNLNSLCIHQISAQTPKSQLIALPALVASPNVAWDWDDRPRVDSAVSVRSVQAPKSARSTPSTSRLKVTRHSMPALVSLAMDPIWLLVSLCRRPAINHKTQLVDIQIRFANIVSVMRSIDEIWRQIFLWRSSLSYGVVDRSRAP